MIVKDTIMIKKIYIALAAFGMLLTFSACNPEAKAVSGLKVSIDINPYIISSGFVKCKFTPSDEAYYHIGIVAKSDAPDTTQNYSVKSFMALQLDIAYAEYMDWRIWLLADGVQPVAEFPTHSLQYGTVEHNFPMLEPNKEYMIYAFVVDSHTNKPDGRLFTYYVNTTEKSEFEDIKFEYRVRGYWDYIYPILFNPRGAGEEIVDYVPWVGATTDSLNLVQYGYSSPAAYFEENFAEYILYKEDSRIHYGIYAHNNNGIGDGTSTTYFESGHTYYTGITLMDGYQSKDALTIYKFTWQDEKTQLLFKPVDRLSTDW